MRVSAVNSTRQSGQALIESVISASTVLLALIGVVHLIALAWWAIAVPLVNAEVQRLVLKQLSLVQLVADPPELGLLTDVSQLCLLTRRLIAQDGCCQQLPELGTRMN